MAEASGAFVSGALVSGAWDAAVVGASLPDEQTNSDRPIMLAISNAVNFLHFFISNPPFL